jgi:p-hydroxybenzoate 3-monooxygenase
LQKFVYIDDGQRPLIRFRRHNAEKEEEIECDFIGGCDGGKSQCCRESIPKTSINKIEHNYPYCWLSILVDSPPSDPELIYSYHEEYGFAVHSLRSLTHGRYHLQVSENDTLDNWTDEKIWIELNKRLTPMNQSWKLNQGEIIERGIFSLRHSINIPMQYKRLFLVGDAAHIVPPTAAKGLNLAVSDAYILSEALIHYYDNNQFDKLNDYTKTCLIHISQAHEFAHYMTLLLHKLNISDENNQSNQFDLFMQKTRQELFQRSHTLQRHIAQMYAN